MLPNDSLHVREKVLVNCSFSSPCITGQDSFAPELPHTLTEQAVQWPLIFVVHFKEESSASIALYCKDVFKVTAAQICVFRFTKSKPELHVTRSSTVKLWCCPHCVFWSD